MTRTSMAWTAALVILLLLAAAVAVGSSVPADMRLPIHWGVDGQADGFAGKWVALLLPAAMVAAVSLLFYFLPVLEPRRDGLERSEGLYLWGWMALLLMGGVIQLAVTSAALDWNVAANRLVVGGIGLMLILIGNQLGKSRSMYLIGLRTPWTLASEEVWIKTHRLGGKLMVGSGLAGLVAAMLPLPPGLMGTILMMSIAVAVIVPIIYSYLLWRRERSGAPQSRR